MIIVVSACLLGENCKYNGGNNANEKIIEFCRGHEVISVCPETEGGMPTPRIPSEIVNGRVTNAAGEDVDEYFRRGTDEVMKRISEKEIDLAILQSRSPSCGSREIYDGTFSKTLIPGRGVFAERLAESGVRIIDSSEFISRE